MFRCYLALISFETDHRIPAFVENFEFDSQISGCLAECQQLVGRDRKAAARNTDSWVKANKDEPPLL